MFSNKESRLCSCTVSLRSYFSLKALGILSSKSAISKIAYRGENFIPVVVPRTSSKAFQSNSKMLFLELFRTMFFLFSEFYKGATCLLLIPNIFEEKPDLHYMEC